MVKITNRDTALKILNLTGNPNEDEIKKAYRKLAMQYHPDKNSGDKKSSEKFIEVQHAYEYLLNPNQQNQNIFEGFSGFEEFNNQFNAAFEGFFAFGRNQPPPQPVIKDRPGSLPINLGDVNIGAITVSLSDVLFSKLIRLNLQVRSVCHGCLGTKEVWEICNLCSGVGGRSHLRQTIMGTISQSITCEKCSGTGWHRVKNCNICNGNLVHHKTKVVEFEIPKKFKLGQKIRLGSRGNENWKAPDGDIILQPFVEFPDLSKLDSKVKVMLEEFIDQ